jgi:hypothetical protein
MYRVPARIDAANTTKRCRREFGVKGDQPIDTRHTCAAKDLPILSGSGLDNAAQWRPSARGRP